MWIVGIWKKIDLGKSLKLFKLKINLWSKKCMNYILAMKHELVIFLESSFINAYFIKMNIFMNCIHIKYFIILTACAWNRLAATGHEICLKFIVIFM
jgi:hypothetical protein